MMNLFHWRMYASRGTNELNDSRLTDSFLEDTRPIGYWQAIEALLERGRLETDSKQKSC